MLRKACGFRHRGYVLVILMMLVTVLLISLAAALPSIYTAAQREREEELIFRGNEYAQAIMLFHRQFNRFPSSVDELVKKTNGVRFLRHAYPDPMSRGGKWRFIHANAMGVILDSRTLNGPQQALGQKPPSPITGSEQGPGNQDASGRQEEQKPEMSSFFGNEMQGAFIVGVASSSRNKSIRVWNNHTRYDDWEFIGIQTSGVAGAALGAPAAGAAQQTPPMAPAAQNPAPQQ